jgi:hypothetical protein
MNIIRACIRRSDETLLLYIREESSIEINKN